jgi:hypothetical protein
MFYGIRPIFTDESVAQKSALQMLELSKKAGKNEKADSHPSAPSRSLERAYQLLVGQLLSPFFLAFP